MVRTCPQCNAPLAIPPAGYATDSPEAIVCVRCGFDSRRLARETPHPFSHSGSSELRPAGDAVTSESVAAPARLFPAEGGGSDSDRESQSFGHFRLVRESGRSAFGAVWLAEDTRLSRRVALKLPAAGSEVAQLLDGARVAARLRHPGIASIYEVGEQGGQPFIASEFIEGCALRDEMRHGRSAASRAVEIMAEVARAVHYAHEMGVVHGHLQPANVIIDAEGAPHITDFGAAESGAAESLSDDVTGGDDGPEICTVAYQAPEQTRGDSRNPDGRTDVYALGVILFELLTGDQPFRGSVEGVLRQKAELDPPSLRTLVPTISRDLDSVCCRCLERDPDNRYASALELADELDRVRQRLTVRARPVSRLGKLGRWCRRNPVLSALSAAFVLSVLAGLLITARLAWRAAQQAEGMEDTLYRTRMVLAADSWRNGDLDRLNALLEHYSGDADELAGQRDFAWNHFRQLGQMFPHVVHHGTRVDDVAIARDGTTMATTGLGGHIRLWDTEDGSELRTLGRGDVEFLSITFSTIDNRLIAGCDDGLIRVWDPTQHGRLLFDLNHGAPVTAVAVSPDGQRMASAGRKGIVRLWDLPAGMPANRTLFDTSSITGAEVHSLRYSHDGSRLAIVYAGTQARARSFPLLVVIDSTTGEIVFQGRQRQIQGTAFTRDDQFVLTTTRASILQRINLKTGDVEAIRLRSGQFGDIAQFEIDGKTLTLVTHSSGALLVLNVDMKIVNEVSTHRQTFGMLDVSAESGLAVSGSGDGTARLMALRELVKPAIGWRSASVRSVCFASDDSSVTIAEADGSVSVWDPSNGTFSELISTPMPPRPVLAVTANRSDGTVACCGLMRDLRVAEFESGMLMGEVQLPPGGHSSISVSPDGTFIACGGRGGAISVFRSSVLNDRVAKHVRTDIAVTDLEFCPSGDVLVAAYEDGRLVVLSPDNGVEDEWDASPDNAPVCLDFSPDGKRIAVGTRSGIIQIYEYPSGQRIRSTRSHAGQVHDVAWFPEGDLIASGGQDAEVRIWDADTGALVTRLIGHQRQVLSVDVSADGRSVVSSGLEGDVRLWRSSD